MVEGVVGVETDQCYPSRPQKINAQTARARLIRQSGRSSTVPLPRVPRQKNDHRNVEETRPGSGDSRTR